MKRMFSQIFCFCFISNWPFSIEKIILHFYRPNFMRLQEVIFLLLGRPWSPLQDILVYHLEWEMCKRIIRTGNHCSPKKVNSTGDELVWLQYIKWYIKECICKNRFKTSKKCQWFTRLLWNKCHFFCDKNLDYLRRHKFKF